MKKIAVIILILVLCFSAGCKNKKDVTESFNESSFINTDSPGITSSNPERALANDAAVRAAFTLDYRPIKAEPINEYDTLSAAELSGSAASGSGQRNITGGGLRKLSDYRTSYFDPDKEAAKIAAILASQQSVSQERIQTMTNEPLTVIDWGPRGEYSSAVQRPSIYVVFSQPMIALAALGEQSASSPLVTINPSIKGTFRWYGTSFLSFEGEEPCKSQQTYTITVASNARSLGGNAIHGDTVFSFVTETLSIDNIIPGEEYTEKTLWHFDNNNVPPQAAKTIAMVFNYPAQAAEVNQYLGISAGGEAKRFTLKQNDEYKITAELTDNIPFETEVKIILKKGAKSRGGSRGTEADQSFSFFTPGAFNVTNHYRDSGYGRYSNIIDIYFSHDLNENTIRGAISTEPGMRITGENVEVYSNMVRISNLPVSYGDRFRINISTNAEDVYGRKLKSPFSAEIVMPQEPPPVGTVRVLDYRSQVMLEAQFPPRYLFEYSNNLSGSFYFLAPEKNPFLHTQVYRETRRGLDNAKITMLPAGDRNIKYFEQIDLKPFLNNNGKGFVAFSSNINILTREWAGEDTYRTGSDTYTFSQFIQVTDLGLTVRYGFNKAAVLVTNISTGRPVEGARVMLLANSDIDEINDLSLIKSYAEAVSDKNGLAVLNMNSLTLRNNTSINGWYNIPFIMAEKDGDRAIFNPSTHNMWSAGVNTSSPQRAEEIIPVAFMFSDRGLYKPGETITFRGVDRSKVLGMYTIYNGTYTVILEDAAYSQTRVALAEGTSTASGSFFGQITLPDDLQPGSYRLIYRRTQGEIEINEAVASVPITVAFFERLKFQAALSSPPEAVILGDDINLTLRASYLSGGSLSGAGWESAWYEEMGVFQPAGLDTRGFVFGPRRVWDSKRHIGSDEGSISGQGVASITRKTGGSKVTGAPYNYQAEVRVTDLSNQMVTAYRTVTAHPAGFYIGLNRGSGGFVRAGQEFNCNYITVNTGGAKSTSANSLSGLYLQTGEGAKQLKVELLREEWRRTQQRGVNGYINNEYTHVQITDSVQMINIQNDGGTVKVKPSAAGYHILRVTSKDNEGRTALTEMGFYVTGASGYWNMNNPTELRLVPDQDMYEPGETAKVLLQSALPAGYYLITTEREGIFTEEVRQFTESVSVIDVPIARNYVPVVYVSVSSFSKRGGPPSHEYGNPDLDKPGGYYGVARLDVNPRTKAFSVSVQTDKKTYRPGDEVTVTLSASRDGKPLAGAELSLMAVDRGVLDLINYRVPDPIKHFYSDELFNLFVNGGDSRSMLMDPVTYSVRDRMGGDSEDSKIEERKDFNPTAVFEPMLVTDSSGKVTHTFKLPDNLTTYRVTVFGAMGDLFALKESEIAAQNRLNVREVVPRRLRERDTAEAGVLITNLDSASHSVTVKLDIGSPGANDGSSGLSKIPGQAFIDGTAERKVTVKSGENAVVYFDVAAAKHGNVTLNFTVNSAILNERLVREMIIERPYVMETVTTTGTVSEDSASEGLVIPSYADNGVGNLSLTLDATRLALLDSAVSYLFTYPYGCLEQRSSAMMPLVVFGEYISVFNLASQVSNPGLAAENEFKKWGQLQLSNGGFPYWPTDTNANFYVSLRIAHTIAAAKEKNISVPSSINTSSLVSYLNREFQAMQSWRSGHYNYYYQSYLQSYMLYVFALLGERVDTSRLAEILARDNADPSVLAFAGMTYNLLNRSSEAAGTAQRLRNLMRLTAKGVDLTDPMGNNRFSYYGGNIEQLALSLEFFAQQFPGDDINTRLLYTLLENQRSQKGYWESTAVTVRILSAVDALIRAENLADINVRAQVMLGAAQLLEGTFMGLGAKPVTKSFDFSDSSIKNIPRDRLQQLDFTRRGTGNIYYTASLRYAVPSELQFFRDEGIGVFLSIHDVNTGAEIKNTALQSGKTYRAKVRVSSSRDRTYLALRAPVPSGAEILDMAFVTTASYEETGGESGADEVQNSSYLSYQAIMDNEVQYFWDRFYRGESTVSFLFRTARRGVYPTPPVQAECMYESEIFGRSKGLIYTIE
ncbi:MAG: alpha-2-macroglobulin [Treponema sp.]|nr:alpha-2-macroglobulin [Treponema sp.]